VTQLISNQIVKLRLSARTVLFLIKVRSLESIIFGQKLPLHTFNYVPENINLYSELFFFFYPFRKETLIFTNPDRHLSMEKWYPVFVYFINNLIKI